MNLRQSLRKTTTVLILALLVLHLAGLPGAMAQTNARPSGVLIAANAGITIQKPQVRVTEEADLPKAAAEEEGWFSRYKWWLLAGLVVIAGGAAAAGGGGGSDSSGGGSSNGGIDVTW